VAEIGLCMYVHTSRKYSGLTSEVRSGRIAITDLQRGTAGYRAPELLQVNAYTKKLDIWAFGCILHELATLKKAFLADIDVGFPVSIPELPYSEFFNHHISEIIRDMLWPQPLDRPSVSVVSQLVCS
jgi:serine/threonine protein kinase